MIRNLVNVHILLSKLFHITLQIHCPKFSKNIERIYKEGNEETDKLFIGIRLAQQQVLSLFGWETLINQTFHKLKKQKHSCKFHDLLIFLIQSIKKRFAVSLICCK